MKKLLSILLTVCMLLSMLIIPVGVQAIEAEDMAAYEASIEATVTFVKDGVSTTKDYIEGEEIQYEELAPKYGTDYVWSLSETEYKEVPEKAYDGLTVYAIETNVNSFENYKVLDYQNDEEEYLYPNTQLSTAYASTGKYSIKYRNYGVGKIQATEPADWNDGGKYCRYDELTDTWSIIPAGDIPAFEANKYAKKLSSSIYINGQYQALIPIKEVKKGTTVKYKVSFKYLATDKNTTPVEVSFKGCTIEYKNRWFYGGYGHLDPAPYSGNGSGYGIMGDYAITIPAGSTNGEWKTAELYLEKEITADAVIALKLYGDVAGNTNEIYIDDITVTENYDNTPVFTKHNVYDNGEYKNIEVDVTSGNVALDIPAAADGKYFMGWYTEENGGEAYTDSSVSVSSGTGAAVARADLYARYGDYVDNKTYTFDYANNEAPAIDGIAYMNGTTYSTAINEDGFQKNAKKITEDGLVLGMATYADGNGLRVLVHNTQKNLATQPSSVEIGTRVIDTANNEIGVCKKVGWDVNDYDSFVIRDENGVAAVPKANTKYAAIVTYKKIGNGDLEFTLTAGRTIATINKGYASNKIESNNSCDYIKLNSTAGVNKTDSFDTHTFTFTTGDYTDEVPVLSLKVHPTGFWAKRVEGDSVVLAESAGGAEKTYYPYEIVDIPEVLIKEIKIIEFIPAAVTFVKDGVSTTKDYIEGEEIQYEELAPKYGTDYVWSLSETEYKEVPEKAYDGLTVYAIETNVNSFENYKVLDYQNDEEEYLYPNTQLSTAYASTGKYSIKYRNYGVGKIQATEPADWNDGGKYCRYDELTDTWSIIPAGDIPAFEANKYAKKLSSSIYINGQYQALIPIKEVKKGTTVKYKVSFKYLATDKNTTPVEVSFKGCTIEYKNRWFYGGYGHLDPAPYSGNGSGYGIMGDYAITIPAGSTNGEWKTAELYLEKEITADAVIALKLYGDVAGNTNEIYIDDITVTENYDNTPVFTKHNVYDNGEYKNIEVDVTSGNVALDIPAAADGKYFMGWYTEENGGEAYTDSSVSVSSGTGAAVARADLYARYGDYVDNKTYTFDYANNEAPAIDGIAYMNGTTYSTAINEDGFQKNAKKITEDGLVLGMATYADGNGLRVLVHNTQKNLATQPSSVEIGTRVIDTANNEIGVCKKVGWDVNDYDSFVIRDENGVAAVPKANTKYAAIVTYKKIGNGDLEFTLTAGRTIATINKGYASNKIESNNSCDYIKLNSTAGVNKTDSFDTHTFTFTTGDYTDEVPVLSLKVHPTGFWAKRVEGDSVVLAESAGGAEKTYYPYEIVDIPEVLIKEIKIIEVGADDSVITYKYYEDTDDYKGFYGDITEGKNGDIINFPSTKVVDNKWYTDAAAMSPFTLTTYDGNDYTLYNGAYYMTQTSDIFNSEYLSAVELERDGETVYALKYDAEKLGYYNPRRPFRLNNVQDGHTYKVTFKYMAEQLSTDMTFDFVTGTTENAWGSNYAFGKANAPAFKAEEVELNKWNEVTCYFTADLDGNVKYAEEHGRDYTLTNTKDVLYIFFVQLQAGKNTVYFSDFAVEDMDVVVGTGSASVLTDDAEKEAEQQAIRYYFNYETTDGTDFTMDGKTFTVQERGFIYKNGTIANNSADIHGDKAALILANVDGKAIVKTTAKELNSCWAYEGGKMTFSTYITGFDYNDERKIMVRAYLTIKDEVTGALYTIYSDTINRSVRGVKSVGGAATDNDFFAGS